MQKLNFDEAVEAIKERDNRFSADAYMFVRDALDFTLQSGVSGDQEPGGRHVSGPELLDGFRRYALQEFGPMVPTVFDEWGLKQGGDVGAIVFNLIEIGVFGKADTDSPQDFSGCYTFEEAFVEPFLPRRNTASGVSQFSSPEQGSQL